MTISRLTLFLVLLYIFIDSSNSEETCTPYGHERYSSFINIGNNYYNIPHDNKTNWFKAREICQSMGADLATITDDGQLTAISNHLMSLGYGANDWFWTAGNDLAEDNNFHWVSNGERMTFTKWSAGQPFGGEIEDCVHLWLREGQFKMNDWICKGGNAYYICQAPIPKTVCVW
ncbi:C-type lectin 37Db-like [Teleopsis dalmanni]|uniref:C-type lectin 37Db-like n=1 Tax=Teleopsis dalmanni TaxID=139649 RepID=UPI0018CFC2B4|nr:C-type lectin 37Db-like [Teleopsis dalmanni]